MSSIPELPEHRSQRRWPSLRMAHAATTLRPAIATPGARARSRSFALRMPRYPEVGLLVAVSGLLNLWALSRNDWANTYYSAAVRSMSTSWHNFLFGSLDSSGVMTVDKPPLALWVQSLSVRIFGFHPLAILMPEALMGVASVVLVYDLVRRRFGRLGGVVAGIALATTPIAVAISRHNNPDALLILCSVAALWCAMRALENGRTRWLVGAGVCVGLGFETKMGVALMVVPGIAAAWLWVAPRGRLVALRQLLAGGVAMVVVGGAWPTLVALTPAADRPWISGTSDNSVFSLILNYNGLGRLDGQTGGPSATGAGGSVFGGSTGPLRLLNSALGGQAGWLLGFALVAGVGVILSTRLRRSDARTGWLIAVGGAFLTTAVAFSVAKGIFHPYYVSLLAPFVAALVGAGAAEALRSGRRARIVGAAACAGGLVTELAVRHDYPGQLGWLVVPLIVVVAIACVGLLLGAVRVRAAALLCGLAILFVAPAVWAVDTLGYATSSTFPSGGPASVASAGGFGMVGGFGGRPSGVGGFGRGGGSAGRPGGSGSAGAVRGAGGVAPGATPPTGVSGIRGGGSASLFSTGAGAAGTTSGGGASLRGLGGGAGFAGQMGATDLTQVTAYVRKHGGGTIAVSSQSDAASAILSGEDDVAGIGGFSGRESVPSISWLAQEVSAGHIRWVLGDTTSATGGLPGDTRAGATVAIDAAAKACRKVSLPSASASSSPSTSGFASTATQTLYDCAGRASALLALAG
jgi:4-amino-4-deoxy-L-arabinose transferase-like glycosyltransferase